MIIGINGKIGSGKDTVGLIILFLTDEIPKANLNSFKEWLKIGFYASPWQIKKFAGKLKEIVCLLTGCTLEQLESQEFKDSKLEKEWDYVLNENNEPVNILRYKDNDTFKLTPNQFIQNYTYRQLLQFIGTQSMRNIIHEDCWVNALFNDYEIKYINQAQGIKVRASDYEYYEAGLDSKEEIVTKHEPNWIITDLRFPNEFQAIKDRKGITIRVNRYNSNKDLDFDSHESENALDNVVSDYIIDNNGTIEQLIERVKQILKLEKLI